MHLMAPETKFDGSNRIVGSKNSYLKCAFLKAGIAFESPRHTMRWALFFISFRS